MSQRTSLGEEVRYWFWFGFIESLDYLVAVEAAVGVTDGDVILCNVLKKVTFVNFVEGVLAINYPFVVHGFSDEYLVLGQVWFKEFHDDEDVCYSFHGFLAVGLAECPQ